MKHLTKTQRDEALRDLQEAAVELNRLSDDYAYRLDPAGRRARRACSIGAELAIQKRTEIQEAE